MAENWTDEAGRAWKVPSPKQWLNFRIACHAKVRAFCHHRDKFACRQCGVVCPDPPQRYTGRDSVAWNDQDGKAVTLYLFHRVPLKRGGTHHPANLETMCVGCTSSEAAFQREWPAAS